MDLDVIQFLKDKMEQKIDVALLVVEESKGSSPGKVGNLMAVTRDELCGTIGGGSIEISVVNKARQGMDEGKHFTFSHNLSEAGDLNMVCGGSIAGFCKYFKSEAELVIFGAGHVSQSICRLAAKLNFNRTVVDPREELGALPAFEGCRFLNMSPKEAIPELPFNKNTYFVVATWNHEQDVEAYKSVLGQSYGFLGGLGSSAKCRKVRELLKADGFEEEEIQRMALPIGIDIADGTPEEIAFSILSEILLVKNKKALKFRRDVR